MAATIVSSNVPLLGRQIHVKKLGQEGEETDESYWLWLDFPETIKGLRSKCMEAFEPPRDYMIRFIHGDQLLCGNDLGALPSKCELWVQFVPKNAPPTPVSARKNRKKRLVLTEDENVDPCPSANIDTGSPIRKRQCLYPRTNIPHLNLVISAPPSPSPTESFKPVYPESPLVLTISSRCVSPCTPLKPSLLEAPVNRNRRNRSNASASFSEPTGVSSELIVRAESPLISSEASDEPDGVPVIAWELENQDESYYGYGILSFDKPSHDWVPSIAFDALPRYLPGVPVGVDFNLLVCDVPFDVTIGEIRGALAANLALDPERLPQGDFDLVCKGQKLEDWMTCVPAYLGDGDAVFIEFGHGSAGTQQGDDDRWSDGDENLVEEDLEEIKLVKLPCDTDSDEE